jgi:2-(1,2-epoxy-1,2-dihydrophenyl)acetyl-CoA isomerase
MNMAGVRQARDGDAGILTLHESERAGYEAQFRREIELQADIRRSADAVEGRGAVVEARFTGR